jgi:hypothetical protein
VDSGAVEPGAVESAVSELAAGAVAAVELAAVGPAAGELVAAVPAAAGSARGEPGSAESAAEKLAAGEPAAVDSAAGESSLLTPCAAELGAGESVAAGSLEDELGLLKPGVGEFVAAGPATTEPAAGESGAGDSAAGDSAAERGVVESAAGEACSGELGEADPQAGKLACRESAVVTPGAGEFAAGDPAAGNPASGAGDPAAGDPVSGAGEPGAGDPAADNPASGASDSVAGESASGDPEPGAGKPGAGEPAAANPAPAPAPDRPATAVPLSQRDSGGESSLNRLKPSPSRTSSENSGASGASPRISARTWSTDRGRWAVASDTVAASIVVGVGCRTRTGPARSLAGWSTVSTYGPTATIVPTGPVPGTSEAIRCSHAWEMSRASVAGLIASSSAISGQPSAFHDAPSGASSRSAGSGRSTPITMITPWGNRTTASIGRSVTEPTPTRAIPPMTVLPRPRDASAARTSSATRDCCRSRRTSRTETPPCSSFRVITLARLAVSTARHGDVAAACPPKVVLRVTCGVHVAKQHGWGAECATTHRRRYSGAALRPRCSSISGRRGRRPSSSNKRR